MSKKRKRRSRFGLQTRRRRFRWWWPFGGLGVLIFLTIIVLAAGYIWLRGSLPEIDGEVQLAGLKADVEVIRDANAIPHIYAESLQDAAFAMGFVHAQDRLWQMEFQRRIGAGRLSEIFGTESLGYDRFLRIEKIKKTLADHLNEKGEISASGFRDLLGITRKHAIPLLEHLDSTRFTMRVGDNRVLRK